MQARITDECIACELCTEMCPEVFEMGDGIAQVKVDTIPQEFADTARKAAEQCPVSAIIIEA